jgi:hypothetical protein
MGKNCKCTVEDPLPLKESCQAYYKSAYRVFTDLSTEGAGNSKSCTQEVLLLLWFVYLSFEFGNK